MLLQREVGQRIGATESCVYLWERGKAVPTFRYWPKIIEFLGYSPFDPAWTPGEREPRGRFLRRVRQSLRRHG